MKSNFINIYFSNFLLKWLGLTLWITEPIKLISREYFISPLRDYKFHLENTCSISLLIYQSNLHSMIRSIILSRLRVHVNISREIYYSIGSRYKNNKSHGGLVQYVLTLKTYQLEVTTSMIKTNHLNWYVIVFPDETPNFITDYELCSKFTKSLWFISSMTFHINHILCISWTIW